MQFQRFVTLAVFSGILLLSTASTAHAYLDPGVGSYFFQLLIAVLMAGLFTLKTWWRGLRSLFSAKAPDTSSQSDDFSTNVGNLGEPGNPNLKSGSGSEPS